MTTRKPDSLMRSNGHNEQDELTERVLTAVYLEQAVDVCARTKDSTRVTK